MARTAWFDGPLPRILAHRGLALDVPQNSIGAFRAALAAGATHLETDARATADGTAVLVHDPRLGSDGPEVGSLRLAELRAAAPDVCTLAEALRALPDARFNIDVKDVRAAEPVAAAVLAAGAVDRVLLTSFRGSRRRAALRRLPPVAASASSGAVALALAATRLRLRLATRAVLAGVDAVQIPERAGSIDLTSPDRIAAFHAAGVEVHFWVVNDPDRMRELVRRGADGIVTDRPDLAAHALR
ncbi:MAG: glycerophosphoryl diester phosphodiesterase [Microbacteriaceae bacterium]|nr:glycerophosphoryl diester phosphodiesterase [Microbacteriaceae bacterium]